MKNKIIAVALLAALCTAAVTSCGTVENVSESSAPIASDTTSTTEATSETAVTEETTTATEPSTEEETTETLTTTTEAEEPATEAENSDVSEPDNQSQEVVVTPDPTAPPATEAPTEAHTAAPTEAPAGSFTHDDMTFVYGGTYAEVLTEASGLVSALGSPVSVEEAPSCLRNGNDVKIYYYSGITVFTYIEDGREVIYEIEITSPSFSTTKGVTVGMTVAQVEALYGKNYSMGGGVMSYYDSASTYLYFIVSGDQIVSIGYAAEV